MRGYLFVFEGPDGVGKTTIINNIYNVLTKRGFTVVKYSFPGNDEGTLGKLIYSLHHDPNRFGILEIDVTSIQLLHLAAHVDVIERQLIPELTKGKIILLDRYWWSIYAYGRSLNINEIIINKMIDIEKSIWNNYNPSLLFLLERKDAILSTVIINDYFLHLERLYIELVECESKKYPIKIIENNSTIHKAVNDVLESIDKMIPPLTR